jgi:2-C-methyl-D-erythritol 4-phosphate cytidylyltransferase/2-C-methyl-D-erythritol 2,4-cyclodiphosphate synthase
MPSKSKHQGKSAKVAAIITAAGQGKRFGGDGLKQYLPLTGKPVLRHSVEAFTTHPDVDAVIVITHPDHEELYNETVQGLDLLPTVHGGNTRQESVFEGLKALQDFPPDYVLIHDAARPFVTAEMISRVVDGLSDAEAVIPTLPVIDTIKETDNGAVVKTIERNKVKRVQTPQGFHFKTIFDAHVKMQGEEFSDDAGIFEAVGGKVAITEGDELASKITTQVDFMRAEVACRQERDIRVGQGYDVHKFIEPEGGRVLKLCGVEVKHDKVLEGHSDADVGLHAITDALLGAMAEEDIGHHFSPKDPRWKDADSVSFLIYACELLMKKGGKVYHVDVTFIGEAPRIGVYRTQMRQAVAEIVQIAEERVSVKATTTEKMGFFVLPIAVEVIPQAGF